MEEIQLIQLEELHLKPGDIQVVHTILLLEEQLVVEVVYHLIL
jgi:hypothetical protein